jgi:hypothetical protein
MDPYKRPRVDSFESLLPIQSFESNHMNLYNDDELYSAIKQVLQAKQATSQDIVPGDII